MNPTSDDRMKIQLEQVLKREMKSRGLSINGLARSCGVPASVLHGWVHGVVPGARNLSLVGDLAEFLGLSVSGLLFNRADQEPESLVLFNSEFRDGPDQYRITIRKMTIDGRKK